MDRIRRRALLFAVFQLILWCALVVASLVAVSYFSEEPHRGNLWLIVTASLALWTIINFPIFFYLIQSLRGHLFSHRKDLAAYHKEQKLFSKDQIEKLKQSIEAYSAERHQVLLCSLKEECALLHKTMRDLAADNLTLHNTMRDLAADNKALLTTTMEKNISKLESKFAMLSDTLKQNAEHLERSFVVLSDIVEKGAKVYVRNTEEVLKRVGAKQ